MTNEKSIDTKENLESPDLTTYLNEPIKSRKHNEGKE